MNIINYLEFVRPEESKNSYPQIIVVGPAKTESGIDRVELRPDGDYLFTVDERCTSLRHLAENARIGSYSFAYQLLDIHPKIIARADFGFDIGSEGACAGRIRINPQHLLAVGRLEDRLTKHHDQIIRGTGGYARI